MRCDAQVSASDESPDFELVIVDDDDMFATLMTRQLKRSTTRYRIFNDSVDALRYLRNASPNMLLIDFRMPVMDGVQLLTALRDDSHASAPNTIIYSSCLPPLDVQRTILSMQARLITKDQLLANNALLHFLKSDEPSQRMPAGIDTHYSLPADCSGVSRKPPD